MTNTMLCFTLVILGLTLGGCAIKEGKVHLSYSKAESNYVKLSERRDFDSIIIRLLTGFSDEAIHVRTDMGFDTILKHVNTNISIAYARTLFIPSSHFTTNRIFLTIRNIKYTIPINYEYIYCDISVDNTNVVNVQYNEILVLSMN